MGNGFPIHIEFSYFPFTWHKLVFLQYFFMLLRHSAPSFFYSLIISDMMQAPAAPQDWISRIWA